MKSHLTDSPRCRGLWPLLAVAALAAGCAASAPAPIVTRTTPSAAAPPSRSGDAARPAAGTGATAGQPPAASAQPSAPPPAAPDASAVQTAPVRSGSVESRTPAPGAAAPAPAPAVPGATAPGAAASGAAAPGSPVPGATAPGVAVPGQTAPGSAAPAAQAPAAPALPPGTRTQPRGMKLPYSDAALAEMRGADAAASRAPAAVPTEPPRTEPSAAADSRTKAAPESSDSGAWGWPAAGRVLQNFDESSNKGISLAGKIGDPVVAAADGRVIFSGSGPRGYGNLVIVKHGGDLLSVYAHNKSLSVKEGQNVNRGQKIAELGESGTNSPKLHFEIRQQGKPVDPLKFLPRR